MATQLSKKRVPERKQLHRERTRDIHKDLLLSLAEYWLAHAYEETTQGWAILVETIRDQGVWWSDRAWNNVYSQRPDWKKEN